jgi:hypothetical protein
MTRGREESSFVTRSKTHAFVAIAVTLPYPGTLYTSHSGNAQLHSQTFELLLKTSHGL